MYNNNDNFKYKYYMTIGQNNTNSQFTNSLLENTMNLINNIYLPYLPIHYLNIN